MAFSNGYIFGFATAVCVVCSLGVAGAATALKDMQDLNRERDLHANILGALGLIEEGKSLPGEEIDRMWAEKVRIAYIDAQGGEASESLDQDGDGDLDLEDVALARDKAGDGVPEVLAVFQRVEGDAVTAYGLEVHGKGLWGPISGYIALDDGGAEVMGVTFFAPKETPGLGAEIMSPKFKSQWKGKRLVNDAGQPTPITVAKGEAPDDHPHQVDGVSGATITCRGVNGMLESGVAAYTPYLQRIQKGG